MDMPAHTGPVSTPIASVHSGKTLSQGLALPTPCSSLARLNQPLPTAGYAHQWTWAWKPTTPLERTCTSGHGVVCSLVIFLGHLQGLWSHRPVI